MPCSDRQWHDCALFALYHRESWGVGSLTGSQLSGIIITIIVVVFSYYWCRLLLLALLELPCHDHPLAVLLRCVLLFAGTLNGFCVRVLRVMTFGGKLKLRRSSPKNEAHWTFGR